MYFYLKEPKSDKSTPIILVYYIKSEKKYFKYRTGQKIIPNEWDTQARYPKLKRGAVGKKNKQISLVLDNYKNVLEQVVLNFDIKNTPITREQLKNEFDKSFKSDYQDGKIPYSIRKAIIFYIDTKKESGGVSQNWLNKYNNLKNKITFFDIYKKTEFTFSDINENWLDAYCGFLRDFPNVVDRKKAKEFKIPISVNTDGYNDNSLHRHIKLFLTFLTWVRTNYDIKIPNIKNPVKTYDTDDVHLTDEEVRSIEKVKLERSSLERARDIFLIGVYSGQRFSDYSMFEKADVKGGMIIKKAEKTEKESFIPLHDKLKKLLDKYDWQIPKISSQKFNPHIKEICKKAKINERVKKITYRGNSKVIEYFEKWELITSHTARRTFITLSSEKGMPDHIIMAITGIRDTKTLSKYKKTNQTTVKDFMNKIWG